MKNKNIKVGDNVPPKIRLEVYKEALNRFNKETDLPLFKNLNMNAKEKANQIYELLKPSVIDNSQNEQMWWHYFAQGKAERIVKEVIIPRLAYMFTNDAEFVTEIIYWDEVKAHIKNVQPPNDMQCDVK